MILSKNFTLEELTKSSVASRFKIDNTPSSIQQASLKLLAEKILQPVRDHYNSPVIITSGFRCMALNAMIGSKTSSQHIAGEAADFEVLGFSNLSVAEWIRDNLNFDQLILEFYRAGEPSSGWVHCSFKTDSQNRKEVLTISNEGVFTGLRG